MNKVYRGALMGIALVSLAACAPTSKQLETGMTPSAAGKNQASATSSKGGRASALNSQNLQEIPLNSPNSPIAQRTIYFAFNSSQIEPKYLSVISRNAKYLAAHPNLRVRIEGNTDDRGTQAYNMALGERRALSVAKLLELEGVSPKQVEVISYGKDNPVCFQQTESCWAKNRRVNIVYPLNSRP